VRDCAGVESITEDFMSNKVTVTGFVSANVILSVCRQTSPKKIIYLVGDENAPAALDPESVPREVHDDDEPETAPEPESTPEPAPEPVPEPAGEPVAAPEAAPEPEANGNAEPQTSTEPASKPEESAERPTETSEIQEGDPK
jgi:hypothetical protein